MSHARLTLIGVATAVVFIAGCAGPAWFVRGESLAEGSTSDDKRSLTQVLDDLERIKSENPSHFAFIQSAVEDQPSFIPPKYQQVFRDQRAAVALEQQARQPLVEQFVTSTSPAPPAREFDLQATYASPSTPPAVQVASPTSRPAMVASPNRPIDAAAAPLRANVAAQSTFVTGQVGDMPREQTPPTASPPAVTPTTAERASTPIAVAAGAMEPGQWNGNIEQALASLSADLARPTLDRDERARLEIMRRLLYVATNQRDEAVAPIDQLDEDEREYWKHQIHGLLISIDADGKHPTTRRAALASRNLRTALDHLANVSTLDVRNLTFCKEVLSYGEYRVFDSYSFRAKDEVVMYVEVDNFAAHPRGDSFETELHSSYEIVDDVGRRVANVVLPIDKQVSNNRRRDYFIAYLITMPSQIAPGSYRLRLTVEDIIGKKSNFATIDFRVQ